jgi:Na+/melibiose symporter-like transporter
MTKFDIRLRRKQFTQSRIERHKNYQSLMERHYEASKKKTRGMMVVVFLLVLVIAIILAFFGTWEAPGEDKQDEKKDNVTQLFDSEANQKESIGQFLPMLQNHINITGD